MPAEKNTRPTHFSHEHYHELSADETEARVREFERLGFPIEGPSLREAEQQAEPTPLPPAEKSGEHVRPEKHRG